MVPEVYLKGINVIQEWNLQYWKNSRYCSVSCGRVTLLWWSVGGAAVDVAVKWLSKLFKQSVFVSSIQQNL